ncbi:MAG: metal-dependent hydrolase [Desulfamplus sp.]|nr:metal-dependent hydrolase [Desulfamplus sp.]
MSGFKTHLYGGMVAGAATSACFMLAYPSNFTSTQLSGIFLTGTIGGLLPDLDSDTSRPFSMLFTLLSMIVPVLFFKDISIIWLFIIPYIEAGFDYLTKLMSLSENFKLFPSNISPFPSFEELTPEFIITYFVVSYLFIRYVICEIVKRFTVHRGIMHSIPFAILSAEAGVLIFIPSGYKMAIAVGVSIFAGCLAHLLLDEMNSINLKYGFVPKFKKSAGTALKFRSKSAVGTTFLYLIVLILGARILQLMKFLD